MAAMVRAGIVVSLLFAASVASGQGSGTLRVSVTLTDATQAAVPIAKHALLISDSPPTRAPRRVLTTADGTIVVNLPPGSYVVESDRPVAFDGKGFQWTAFVEVAPGREVTLALTAQNAEGVPPTVTANPAANATPGGEPDPSSQLGKWQSGVVTIWSPTARASGFIVDARGLVLTDRGAVGTAAAVEVQLSSTLKVAARVLVADPVRDVAVAWLDPSALKEAPPIPFGCPPGAAASIDDGDHVIALTASPHGTGELVPGQITGFHPRGIESDLRLSPSEAGGPVFARDDATLVGLTSVRRDEDASRGDVLVVRAGIVCEALAAARSKIEGATPPAPTLLPIEPARSYPVDANTPATTQAKRPAATPPVVASASFEVAFLTPRMLLAARERADWTGGRSGRAPEAEARLGRLTEFGDWAEYFNDIRPVLIARVTPKLVEGFWMRVAREAARTQGADLPAFKDFKSNFLRLRLSCGGTEVTPIHPFVLEHVIGEKRVLREGVYVFSPEAIGPHCASVTATISSEQAPDKPEALTIDPKLLELIWQDFAPYREPRQ